MILGEGQHQRLENSLRGLVPSRLHKEVEKGKKLMVHGKSYKKERPGRFVEIGRV